MKRFAEIAANVDKARPSVDSPRESRNIRAMAVNTSVWRVMDWLAHLPLAILPFLAAAVIQRDGSPDAGTLVLLRIHWFWLLVAAGLGAWIGWRSAGEAAAAGAGRP